MVDIKKYYQYCVGQGYLDKRRYAEDLGQEKMQNRVIRDQMDGTMRAWERETPPRPLPNPPEQLPLFPQPTLLQRAILTVLKPVQVTFALLQALLQKALPRPEQATPKGPAMERILSQIMSFFFGFKKDKTEEKEKRFQQDFLEKSLDGERVVEKADGGGFSSGQR